MNDNDLEDLRKAIDHFKATVKLEVKRELDRLVAFFRRLLCKR